MVSLTRGKQDYVMLTKPLGTTDVLLPEVGLGTWDYHGGVEPLRAGFESGALFVDTAESYGSEEVVGQALAGQRNHVFLASKVSPANFRPIDLLRSADASLRRLGVDHLDLYQLHSPNPRVPIDETMGAMESLVDAGKIRFVGVSNFSVSEMKAAMRALHKYPLVANQVRYNLVDRTVETETLPFCAANGITVISYSPLGREWRRILDCDPHNVLAEVAQATGRTTVQVALNWCLRHDSVVVIPKSNSVNHVRINCGASGWRLTPKQCEPLESRIRFRRRGRWEMAIRGMIPNRLIPVVRRTLARLPRSLRRRLE